MVEDLRFSSLGRLDQMLIEDFKDIAADASELGFDLLTVLLDELRLSLIPF